MDPRSGFRFRRKINSCCCPAQRPRTHSRLSLMTRKEIKRLLSMTILYSSAPSSTTCLRAKRLHREEKKFSMVCICQGRCNLVKSGRTKPKSLTNRKTEFCNFVDFFHSVLPTLFLFLRFLKIWVDKRPPFPPSSDVPVYK